MKVKIGSTRIVFILKNVVVKIPIFFIWRRFINGVASNYREKILCDTNINSNDIAKVYFNFLGLILLSEKVDNIDESEFNKIPKSVKKRLMKYLLHESELIFKNVGRKYINNKVNYVLIDTGVNINPINSYKYYEKFRKLRTKMKME